MPNLENLKKQAKQILRWHRDRRYEVTQTIRQGLPRFSDMSDAAILASDFKLSDALEVVAHQQGFDSWHALKGGLATASDSRDAGVVDPALPAQGPAAGGPQAKVPLASVAPCLFVTSVAQASDFYVHRLGFELDYCYGEPAYWAELHRGAARINLRFEKPLPISAEARVVAKLLAASFGVPTDAGIKSLFLEYQAAGVEFHERLSRQPWGSRSFVAKDPDGNLLAFHAPPATE